MAARGLNVFVNIGANVLGSVNASASKVEQRMTAMGRKLKAASLESSLAVQKFTSSYGGLLGMAAAGGLAFGIVRAIGAGAEYDHELQALRNAGRTTTEVAQAIAAANATIRALPTTTLADNLKVINETTGAYGNFAHAIENVATNQQVAMSLSAAHAGGEDSTYNLIKVLERRGVTNDPARARAEEMALAQAMVFYRGKVSAADMLHYSMTSSPYLMGLDPRYFTRVAPFLAQTMGGDVAGTAQSAFLDQIMGRVGVNNQRGMKLWEKYGLLDRGSIVTNKIGDIKGWKAGAVKGTDLALRNPAEWMEKVMLPTLRAQGVDTNDNLALLKQFQMLFGRRTAFRFAMELGSTQTNRQMHNDIGFEDKVPAADRQYLNNLLGDPKQGVAAIKASMTNLMATLSGPVLIPIARALVSIADGINAIALAVQEHPNLAHGIIGVTLALTGMRFASLALAAGRGVVVGFLADLAGNALSAAKAGLVAMRGGMKGLALAASGLRAQYIVGGWKAVGSALMGAVLPTNLLKLAMTGLKLTLAGLGIGLLVIGLMWLVNNARGIGAFFGAMGAAMAKTAPITRPFVAMIGRVVGWVEKLVGPLSTETWVRWGTNVGSVIGGVVNWVAKLVTGIGDLISNLARLMGMKGQPASGGPTAPHRARGGRVAGGSAYTVGEEGEELFVPGTSGSIIPARATAALLAALAGGSAPMAAAAHPAPVSATFYIQSSDPAGVRREVKAVLKELARSQNTYLSD